MRELMQVQYDASLYTDENVLYRHKLIDTVKLSKNLTYLYGKDDSKFPLLSYAETAGFTNSVKVKLNDTQYEWPVMGRMKHTSKVCGLYNTSNIKPGLGRSTFQVIFEDNWIIGQYTVVSPDQNHICRAQKEGVQIGVGKWLYEFALNSSDDAEFVSLDNFVEGKYWVMGTPIIPQSKSTGTRSNTMSPGNMTNQFSFQRFSKPIAGNIANKVVVYELDTDNGGTTNLWLPFEMKQFEMDRKELLETDLWTSKYNRDSFGQILLKDPNSGEPIPTGAGVFEILKYSGNYDTFNPFNLTLAKLGSTVAGVFNNRIDKTPMEIILYTGAGGMKAFNNAIMNDATSHSYFNTLGDRVIGGDGTYMTYGKYFNQYRTIEGHLITVRECNFFNQGLYAEQDRKNGRMIDGVPMSSYELVFLDHSMDDNGERNIQLVAEKGREMITGIYKGMTNLPDVWKSAAGGQYLDTPMISTKTDEASYEVITSQGIVIKNYTTSFWLHPSI